jgi:hypothetical protein
MWIWREQQIFVYDYLHQQKSNARESDIRMECGMYAMYRLRKLYIN